MEKEKLNVIAEFLKEMKEKYPVDAKTIIVVELDGDALVVSEVGDYTSSYEGYDLTELERIEL